MHGALKWILLANEALAFRHAVKYHVDKNVGASSSSTITVWNRKQFWFKGDSSAVKAIITIQPNCPHPWVETTLPAVHNYGARTSSVTLVNFPKKKCMKQNRLEKVDERNCTFHNKHNCLFVKHRNSLVCQQRGDERSGWFEGPGRRWREMEHLSSVLLHSHLPMIIFVTMQLDPDY